MNRIALHTQNLTFVERLYQDYQQNPKSVAPDWQKYFESLALADNGGRPGSTQAGHNGPTSQREVEAAIRQDRVDQLIRAYRVRGHIIAQVDPLDRPRPSPPELEPSFYGFTEADMDRPVSSRTVYGPNIRTLRQIIERMRNTYCRSIGVQFMHIDDLGIRHWLQNRMEGTENRLKLSRDEQIRILTRLTDAVIFEEFIQKKYVGAKTFSLEGAESLIPLLDLTIEKAGEYGCDEIVLAMAHRGRLNVLANIIGKSPRQIFREFEDVDVDGETPGDVKYHLGYSSDWHTTTGRKVHLSLCFNPSHLEFVNPVALGRMRAKQDRVKDKTRCRGMALLIHGDAGFAGEGIVQETLNFSELKAYRTGGAFHVIVNNQLGFTTPPSEGRSSLYASGVAKMLQVPIFHVNGEDPEAVAQVVNLAMDFRRDFKRDVVIDMYCYRRHGHNEGDEPEFTQPLLYAAIKQRKSVRDGYLERLLKLGEVTQEEADGIAATRRESLEQDLSAARGEDYVSAPQSLTGLWSSFKGGPELSVPEMDTGVVADKLSSLLEALTCVPIGFKPHPKLVKLLQARREMAHGKRALDWSTAEALAFATLATEGIPVRLTGQDTARGTFSQRHAVLHDIENGRSYAPLQHLTPDQARVEIANSPLSEAGVMGFEYGYSLDYPDALVLWEAQFGDFCNAAQVIIDQFLASGEEKWRRLSGLVLLLPHGFEGQGPEHSSARLERFLALAAEDNMQVVYPTTPAQYFHVLRRQVLRPWRKPLVIMTPKSLLRHPKATSSLEELAEGRFQRIIGDAAGEVKKVLMCSGKIYYQLLEEREKRQRSDVAILRVEQLYPLSDETLAKVLEPYTEKTPLIWVQEEPENMGAWRSLRVRFGEKLLGRPFGGIYRPAAASPATGSARAHKSAQERLIAQAFDDSHGPTTGDTTNER